MAKAGQKSPGNKSVAAGESPFVNEEAVEEDLIELEEEEEELEEEEEEEELELEELETETPSVTPAKKVVKPVVSKPTAPAKTAAAPKAKVAKEAPATDRTRLAPETRVVLTEVGRSLNGKGCHDAIAGVLRARKSGSATVAELLAKLPSVFVPRTAKGDEAYFRGYIGAAVRKGFLTIA